MALAFQPGAQPFVPTTTATFRNIQPTVFANPTQPFNPLFTMSPMVPPAELSRDPSAVPPLLFDQRFGYYWAPPGSLLVFPPGVRHGLIALSIVASLSLLLGGGLLCYLTYRSIVLRRSPGKVHRNQYIILIYNLLVADTLQAIGFLISINWLQMNAIIAPTVACFAQGFLIQLGDVSSAVFVLLIAIFTFSTIVKEVKVPYTIFLGIITAGWTLAIFLSVLGPAIHGRETFMAAGAWCWIPQIHAKERLALHYFWIFLAEFVTLALYIYLFVFLYRRTRNLARNMRRTTLSSPTAGDVISQLYKAARYMLLYPLVYIVLTLPLSIGRMLNMQGYEPPLVFWTVMGSLMTSAGWVDAIVYSITRGVLVTKDPANLGRTESAQSLAQYGAAAGSTAAPGAQGAGRHVDDDDDALSRYGGALGSPKPRDSFMTSGGKEVGGELASKTSVVSAPSPPPQTKSTLQ